MRDLTYRVSATTARAFDKSSDELGDATTRHASKVAEWQSFGREAFGRLYRPQDATRTVTAPDSWALRATDALTTSPDWSEAVEAARSHRVVAAATTATLLDAVAKALGVDGMPDGGSSTDPRSLDRAARRAQEAAQAAWERMTKANDERDDAAAQDARDEFDAASAAAKAADVAAAQARARRAMLEGAAKAQAAKVAVAVAKAAKEAKAMAEAVALLAGVGVGGDGVEGDIDEELLRLVRDSADVREVLRQVGRSKDAATKRTGLRDGGRLDVLGVDAGRDVFSLASSEMLLLSMGGVARLDVLSRAEQGAALVVSRAGDKPAEAGDFVLLVDRSGSMAGARQRSARAFAMGSILRALGERRRVVVVAFDDGPAARAVVERDGRGLPDAVRALLLPARGGTDAVGAMRSAVDALSTNERARVDTLIVTDGEWSDPTPETLRLLRRGGGSFKAVLVDGAGQSKDWLDGVWSMSSTGDVKQVR